MVYVVSLGFAIWGMMPNKALNDVDEDEEESESASRYEGKDWEMQGMSSPGPMSQPFTPRTQAFHTLDRKLPLRSGSARYR